MIEQRRAVARDALHGEEPLARRRGAEPAAVEAYDLARGREIPHLVVPHGHAQGKGVEQEQGGPAPADVVGELSARDPGLHVSSRAARAAASRFSTMPSATRAITAMSLPSRPMSVPVWNRPPSPAIALL